MYMQIRMPLACLLILVYALILYGKKRRLHTKTSRIFEWISMFSVIHVLSAVVTEYTVNNRDKVLPFVNLGWHLVFLISISLVVALLYLYVLLYVERGSGQRKRGAKIALAVVTGVSILGELALPITYIDTDFGSYSYGPKAFSLYLIVVYALIMMTVTALRYRSLLNRDQTFVILTSVATFIIISLIQIAFPYILLTGLGMTMVVLGLSICTEDVHMYSAGESPLFNELGCREILQEAVLNQTPFQVGVYIFIGQDEAVANAMLSVHNQLPEKKAGVICGMLADNLLLVIPLQRRGKTADLPELPTPEGCTEDISYVSQTMSFSGDNTVNEILDALRRFKSRYEEDTLMRDDLTGYLRRAPFLRQVEYMINSGQSFTFLMIDMDNFKQVNDCFGHGTGDEIIQMIAQGIRNELRPTDVLCRMGGDEFGIVLPEVTIRDNVIHITDRIQSRVSQIQAEYEKNTQVTLSIGAKISLGSCQTRSFQSVYAQADAALYHSKYKGKNRLTFASDSM